MWWWLTGAWWWLLVRDGGDAGFGVEGVMISGRSKIILKTVQDGDVF